MMRTASNLLLFMAAGLACSCPRLYATPKSVIERVKAIAE